MFGGFFVEWRFNMRNQKKGFIYLIANSNFLKFGVSSRSVKNRLNFYNKNNNDKFELLCLVKSKNIFKEENDYRWYLNSNHQYSGSEFCEHKSIKMFEEFFKDRIIIYKSK